jgi:hypothetical protein
MFNFLHNFKSEPLRGLHAGLPSRMKAAWPPMSHF